MKPLKRSLYLLGVALIIFSAKLSLIDTAGSDLPLLDQWDGEAEKVIRPWLEGHLTASGIFASHNEHRIITTKLYALGLVMVGGQWNALVATTTNAAIHTLGAIALLLLTRRWVSGRWTLLMLAVVILLFALPFAWENTLYGFQVQFYFLLIFSLGHLVFALEHPRHAGRWWVGQFCGLLAIATMASGFLSSVAVLIVLGVRLARDRRLGVWDIASTVLAFCLTILGWLMKVDVPEHLPLHAHDLMQFARGFLQLLTWPAPTLLPIVFMPAAFFLGRVARNRTPRTADPLLLGLLAWSMLQAAALAYGRGGGAVLASRYFDLLTLNVFLGAVFLITEFSGRTRAWLAVGWSIAIAVGLGHESRVQWHGAIEPQIVNRIEQQTHVRNYLSTLDPAEFKDLSWPQIPYPSGEVLIQRLSSPALQSILPPSVRRPLQLSPSGEATARLLPLELRSSPIAPVLSTWPAENPPLSWRSAPQQDGLPILRFRVIGDIGSAGRDLHLVLKTASLEQPIATEAPTSNRWKTANVQRPAGTWWVEATDNDPTAWFAFTNPIEVSRWSWFAEKLLKHHRSLFAFGVALLAAGAWTDRRKSPPVSALAS